MPVAPDSRYRGLPVHVAPDAAGVAHATIPARPRPRQEADTSPYFHTLVAGETIEQLAWRYLGSSDAWWQIADANPTLFPTAFEPGAVVAVPTSASTGQVERTRPF